MDEFSVALIGYGLAGRVFHRPLIEAVPGLRIDVVVTSNPERQQQVREDLASARVIDDADELWPTADAVDLVVVATSTGSHLQFTRDAIRAGKPVVVEKPLAPTAREARDVVGEAERRGVLLVPFHNRRWDSDHLTVQRLLREGVLGEVLRYESRIDRWRPAPTANAWRERLDTTEGGGVLLDLGVHLVDQAMQLHGSVARVYAEVFSRRGGADDDVFIALAHRSGVTSHLWANALAAAPGPRLRVLGRKAGYVLQHVDGQEDRLRAGQRADAPDFGVEPADHWGRLVEGDDQQVVPSERGAWTTFYTAIERCLRGEGPPPVAAADAVAALRVLDAARTSAEAGTIVAVDSD